MKISFTFLFLILFTFSFAQKELRQNIRGTIKDADTDQALVGVNIYILNSNPIIGTSTDLNGDFILKNVKLGSYDIKISYLSYNTVTFNNVYLTAAKEIILDVELQQKIITSEVIKITATKNQEQINEMTTVSVLSISSIENSHIAGGIQDPSRVILSYAGIKSQGDLNNGFSIRGNKPTNMLWQLEGIEIQDPNHFTIGSSFGGNYINGAVSSISSNLLKNINLYTGSFPAEYGNALSGVMGLSLRSGNDKNFEYNLNIGMLGVEASAEGPIEMGGSFLISFRYSTLDLVSDMGFDVNESKIGYRDLNYKINLPTKKHGTFTAFGMAGWSESKSLEYFKKERIWSTVYNNSVFGFSHKINLSKKSFLKNIMALSLVNTSYHYYNLSSFLNADYTKTNYERKETTYRYALSLHNKLNSKNKLISGLKVSHPKLILNKSYEVVNQLPIYNYSDSSKFDNSTLYLQAFSQWKHRFNNKLSLNSGLHFLLFTFNMNYSIEPRLSLKWAFHKNHTINIGTGLHSKIEFLPMYMAKVLDHSSYNIEYKNYNKNLELSKSFHLAANYTANIFKDFSIKVEPYIQYHFDVPEEYSTSYLYKIDSSNNRPIVVDSIETVTTTQNSSYEHSITKLSNKGTALNFGIETTIQKKFNKNYYFLMSSSFYRSFYKTSKDSVWHATAFDGLFTFSASAGKDFKIGKLKQNLISFNARILWSGGYIKPSNNSNSGIHRYKNYYKLDTRIAYILNKKKFTFTVALDVLNTTNHQNETSEYIKNATGILPVLSFNFRFQK